MKSHELAHYLLTLDDQDIVASVDMDDLQNYTADAPAECRRCFGSRLRDCLDDGNEVTLVFFEGYMNDQP